jgi:hypothetical protein
MPKTTRKTELVPIIRWLPWLGSRKKRKTVLVHIVPWLAWLGKRSDIGKTGPARKPRAKKTPPTPAEAHDAPEALGGRY